MIARSAVPAFLAAVALASALPAPFAARGEPAHFSAVGSVGTAYDDNIYRLSPREIRSSGAAFDSVDDAVVLPQGAIDVHVPFSLQDLEFRAAVGGRYHAYNTKLDAQEYSLLARATTQLGRVCDAALLAEQTRRQGILDDLEEPGSNIQRDRHGNVTASCALMPDLKLGGTADFLQRRSPNERESRFDLDERLVSGRLSIGDSELFQGFFEGIYRHRVQPNFISRRRGRGMPSADIYQAGGGFRWTPSPKLKIDWAAYWSRLDESQHRRDRHRFIAVVGVADWEMSIKTHFRLYGHRDLVASPNVGAIAYPEWLVGGAVDWTATPMLTASLSVEHRNRNILRDRFPTRFLVRTRREIDDTTTVALTTDYAVTDPLHLRFGVDYRRRRANWEDIEFKATTVSLGISYRFGGVPFDTGL